MNFLLSLFNPPKTVDAVLAAFNKTIDLLEKVESEHRDKALHHEEIAAIAQDEANRAHAEADRAADVAYRFRSLVNNHDE